MNAAVRAVVRTARYEGLDVHVIHEGYLGMTDGGPAIQRVTSDDVSGILHQGGTVFGTARSEAFRTKEGRQRAAANLIERGIDALVVIGGDGSLTGAHRFRTEWPDHVNALLEADEIDQATAERFSHLRVVGIVGSIDNDMFGTDMTVGVDTALHRITEAIGAIHSTASSHQRSFVVEVMGRNCGYLALMAGLATGANWIFIPEHPPETDDWRATLCKTVSDGRRIGRRQNIVIVAEGATDKHGVPITADEVQQVLEEGLGEDTRVTILGHVQRGGAPSAFDRNLATQCGYHAVYELLRMQEEDAPTLVGTRDNRIVSSPLMESVDRTHQVADLIAEKRYAEAMQARGGSFTESFNTLRTLVRATPSHSTGRRSCRIAIVHGGGTAPGMNTIVRAAVRVALDGGHQVLGAHTGFQGLRDGNITELDWMSVSGLVSHGGAELGTSRYVPASESDLTQIGQQLIDHRIDGLMVVGGFDGYDAADQLRANKHLHPGLDLPIVCVPATISNDLPATEATVGSDTAINSILSNLDRIKQTGVASRRVFIVEVMGKDSGYLALTSGLAAGAEQVYLPEEGISLDTLLADVERLKDGFREGKRLGLVIRGEHADPVYTTPFLWALFEKEGGGLFDVRQAILGHLQQGGDPSPFDRIQATRLVVPALHRLLEQAMTDSTESFMSGLIGGQVTFTPLEQFRLLLDPSGARRAAGPHWMALRPIAEVMTGPADD